MEKKKNILEWLKTNKEDIEGLSWSYLGAAILCAILYISWTYQIDQHTVLNASLFICIPILGLRMFLNHRKFTKRKV